MEFVKIFNSKTQANSILKTLEKSSMIILLKLRRKRTLYIKDNKCTHCVAYKIEMCFDSYGVPPPKF